MRPTRRGYGGLDGDGGAPHPKSLEPPAIERITICWIVAIVAVAIFGPAWVSLVMFTVVIGGPSARRALTRRLGLDDRD